jgi:hypothetical protein
MVYINIQDILNPLISNICAPIRLRVKEAILGKTIIIFDFDRAVCTTDPIAPTNLLDGSLDLFSMISLTTTNTFLDLNFVLDRDVKTNNYFMIKLF